MRNAVLDTIIAARAASTPLVVFTDLPGGEQSSWAPASGAPCPEPELEAAARESLRSDRSRTVEIGQRRVFVQAHNPRLRLFIVGAVHITQALVPMAALLRYAVTVIDPRGAFATPERFPGTSLSTEWPDDALEAFALDARSAVVTLTHDPKIDDPALEVALRSPAFYVGSLGSRRTHAARCERLAARGFDVAALGRIHAPIGLDIGARSPAEIAAAIAAEVTVALRMEPA